MAASFVGFALVADGPELLDWALAEALAVGATGSAEDGPGRGILYAPAERAQAVARALGRVAARSGGRLRVEAPQPVPPRDWSRAWREGFEALVLPGPLVVRPGFVAPPPEERAGTPVVRIEPGQAFGTGTHESTRLVLELLAGPLAPQLAGSRVLDVGTGTGVLALAALRLGARRAVAIDLDPRATREARANARCNRLADRLELVSAGVEALRESPFDLVLANLLRREMEPILPALGARLAESGRLVLSGLLDEDLPSLAAGLAAAGLERLAEVRRRDPSGLEWVALVTTAAPGRASSPALPPGSRGGSSGASSP